MSLELRPIGLRASNAYVASVHRHSKPTRGHKFSLAAYEDDTLVGVAIVGRPLARALDDGFTAEVLRVCTDGTRNACSFLYGASSRAAKAMGYRKIVTYTLASEPGTSLRAAAFTPVANTGIREGWQTAWGLSHGVKRDDETRHVEDRIRWERVL